MGGRNRAIRRTEQVLFGDRAVHSQLKNAAELDSVDCLVSSASSSVGSVCVWMKWMKCVCVDEVCVFSLAV